MPVRRICSFCGGDVEPGTGKMFIRKDGTIFVFCSSKCQKNQLKLGRLGRTVRWTKRYAPRGGRIVAMPEASIPVPTARLPAEAEEPTPEPETPEDG